MRTGWEAKSKTGVVAAGDNSNAAAAEAGVSLLCRGGNAADAAVATILALCITDHGLCSIGGEVPVLIFDAKKRQVKALCGQGRAPLSQKSVDWLLQNGIPLMNRADIKSAAVPSVVDTCITLLRLYGTLPFRDVAEPALRLLQSKKEPWHANLTVTLGRMIEEEQFAGGGREDKLQAAADRFYGRNRYRNDIADDLEAFYKAKGGFLCREDLAAHVTRVEDPVTIDYRGYTVCKCGPWTQGPVLLQALRLLEGRDFAGVGRLSPDYIHLATEALKLALADRDEYYGDPDFVDVPLTELLADRYSEVRRPLVDMRQASQEARPGDPRGMRPLKGGGVFRPGGPGTTTCVVADRWGNVVAATPSANVRNPDGGKAGVTHGNRLCSFNTTRGHPNCVAPGKRPRITLSPTVVLKGGAPVLAVSVAGGDLQDQVTLNLLLDFIEFGKLPAEAVNAPRFATTFHQDSFDPDPDRERAFKHEGALWLGDGISDEALKMLASRQHRAVRREPPAVPVMLYIDQNTQTRHAAGDRRRSHAAGQDE